MLLTKVTLLKKKTKIVKIQLKSYRNKMTITLIQSELPTFKGMSMLDIQIRKKLRFRVKTGSNRGQCLTCRKQIESCWLQV